MERITYFDEPTQVAFWDFLEEDNPEGGQYIGGIAYCGEIICGMCGCVLDLEELYRRTPKHIKPIKVLSWIDISEAIIGED